MKKLAAVAALLLLTGCASEPEGGEPAATSPPAPAITSTLPTPSTTRISPPTGRVSPSPSRSSKSPTPPVLASDEESPLD